MRIVRLTTRIARLATAVRAAAAAAIIAAAVITGCDHGAHSRPPGFIQVDLETSPPSTDPRFATDAASSRISELIFDSLVRIDRDGQFVGHLADSVERPTPTTIVYHLRRGVKFSDGREVTARDVKFTYDSLLAPETRSAKRAGLARLKSVAMNDDYTIVMTTDRPYAPALELGMQGIVPAGTPLPAKAHAVAPPGAGPFRMAGFVADEAVTLERNPFHRFPKDSPRTILLKVVPNPTVRALELAEGICDFAENNLQPDVLPWLSAQPHLSVSKTPGNSYSYLAFNFRDLKLRDVRVRRAIAYAIDRRAIVDSIQRGAARIATGTLSPESWAYDGEVTTYEYNPGKSRALLEEAGFPPQANGMRALHFVYKTTPEGVRLGEAIQAMLKRVGISLDIRVNEFATFYSDIQAGNFELTSMNWVGINEPNHYYFIFDSKMTPPLGLNR